ncbi:MAG: hypothetical protein J2P15_13225 [Micromonosporaceae bacterium]|nr:hypothetical protein [Micromonosporaceae bacterium]
MSREPPVGYVAFVARHLEPLRAEVTRAIGADDGADELYPEVLTDIAAHWGWLELLRTRLRRSGAADDYLRRAFDRQVQRWATDRSWLNDDGFDVEFEVWSSQDARPVRSSAAVRLAPQLRPVRPDLAFSPIMEAAIAWWHAYESRRRRRWVAVLVAATLLLALMVRALPSGSTG